jgi:hypothetical protein
MTFAEMGTGAVLVLGLLAVFLLTRRPRPGFKPTEEVVRDDAGRRLRLYVNPETGEQQYREEPEPRPSGGP